MVTWEEASQEVIHIAQELVEEYHPFLKEARIGFVFRSEASVSKGKSTVGKVSKISDKMRPVLDLDFLIWIAKDVYEKLDAERRRAVIDHGLTHITTGAGGLTLRHHDIEEFRSIIERYGLWNYDLVETRKAMDKGEQMYLNGLANGVIKALEMEGVQADKGQLVELLGEISES